MIRPPLPYLFAKSTRIEKWPLPHTVATVAGIYDTGLEFYSLCVRDGWFIFEREKVTINKLWNTMEDESGDGWRRFFFILMFCFVR